MSEQVKAPPSHYEPVVETMGQHVDVFVPQSASLIIKEETQRIRDDLSQEDSILKQLGVELGDVGDGTTVSIPKAELLNNTLDGMGITDRRFAEAEGDLIPPVPYLMHIKKGELPLATQDPVVLHDVGNHVGGFVRLPPRAIEIFKGAATEALSSNSPRLIDEAINMVEVWTNIALSRANLAVLYSKRMNPRLAGVLAWKDMRKLQRKTSTKPETPNNMPSQTTLNDSGLPIY